MEIEFKHVKSYRYEVLNAFPKVKTVLYVLHGYGQLAKFFIRKFNFLPDDIMIVAPEGMHRFYVKDLSGRVGASWMTKEARETDISDNISWLNELDRKISKEYPIEKRILLGFSQGGATAARWQSLGAPTFDELILWACVFPPDLNNNEKVYGIKKPYFVIGQDDELYSGEDQENLIKHYKGLGFETVQYTGKHDIHNETLMNILRQIN